MPEKLVSRFDLAKLPREPVEITHTTQFFVV
jgi:hypothetical protein